MDYLKAITDINVANNNLNVGISKDLVYERLKSLGLHLYNSQAGEDVSQYLVGANTGSATWDNDTTITGSYLNNIPRKDLVAELYKRIYHNLPLLLKQKGTVEGLDNLISLFGIPSRTYYVSGSDTFYTPTGSNFTASILNVKEFGGGNKAELLRGYNNDKVRIVNNTLVDNLIYSGSVLSPIHSLQTYPSAAAEFPYRRSIQTDWEPASPPGGNEPPRRPASAGLRPDCGPCGLRTTRACQRRTRPRNPRWARNATSPASAPRR